MCSSHGLPRQSLAINTEGNGAPDHRRLNKCCCGAYFGGVDKSGSHGQYTAIWNHSSTRAYDGSIFRHGYEMIVKGGYGTFFIGSFVLGYWRNLYIHTGIASRARKGLPTVHNYTRGNKRKALAAAADDDQMKRAMSSYIQDWRSAGDTSDDYWSTWTQLHRAHWDGVRREAADLLPLDPLRVHIIGAWLKI